MHEFVQINQILSKKHVGKEVSIRGWVHRKRSSGGVQFIIIRDSTGIIQTAIKKENVTPQSWKKQKEF